MGRRINVQIRDVPHSRHQVVWCHESGCPWVYVAAVKSDALYQARMHREKHRREGDRG